jgi:hypothetical protein
MNSEPNCRYEPGSWSEWVHDYINAKSVDELRALLEKINLEFLHRWTQGLLDEFLKHFEPRLHVVATDSPDWKLIVDAKWNQIGVILAQLGAFKWARRLYELEYSVLCRVQMKKGRVHKGLPLHQIGWVALVEGTPESLVQSKYFIKLALIEDCLTFANRYKTMPAFRVLNIEHQLAEPVLIGLADAVMKWTRTDRPSFECSRPELIYLDIVRESGGSEESDYFQFDSDIAAYLLEEVQNVKS